MIVTIVNLPFIVGIILFVLVTGVVGFIPYLVTRWAIRKPIPDESQKLAETVFRISGALLALLLSLTFIKVRSELIKLRDTVDLEAAQIADIYNDLGRYESPEATAIQHKIVEYTHALINDEWSHLSLDRLSPRAWARYGEIQTGLLNLKVDTPRHKLLQARLLQDIDEISDHRQIRLYHAKEGPPVYLYIAVFGFMITMALLCIYPPNASSILFMCLYTLFVGTVLYFILAMAHPFEAAFSVSSAPFEVIYNDFTSGSRT